VAQHPQAASVAESVAAEAPEGGATENSEAEGGAPEGVSPEEAVPGSGVADGIVPPEGVAPPEDALPESGAAEGADPTSSAEPADSAALAHSATPANSATPARSADSSDSAEPSGGAAPEGYRLVATSRATVEICDRLGLALAGVPSLDGLPERYAGAARTGSAMAPDLEAIRLLAPTEVVGPDTLAGDLAPGYANAGIPATFLNLRGVGGLYESADYLGEKYGAKSEAARLRAGYEAALAELAQKRGGREGPRVLILMGMPGAYVECTQHSYAGDLVALCGGENVVSDPAEGFVSWNTEELLLLDPDVILRTAHALPDLVADMFAKEFSENGVWKHFRAVREGRVYDLDSEVFGMSASFRWPEAFERLSGIFFGDGGYGL
jgi:iron complex transport system substrate-binding protein